MVSRSDWLRERDDEQLAALLSARPDTLLPTPGSMTVLARRLDSPASAHRALARLDRFAMQVLYAVEVLTAPTTVPAGAAEAAGASAARGASGSEIASLLGGPADAEAVIQTAEYLAQLALLIDSGDGWSLPPATREALGRFPAGLGPASGISPGHITRALADIGDARTLLERLVPGPPIGTIEAGSAHRATADRLIELGLLVRRDQRSVLLPREVSLALRGQQPFGAATPHPPQLTTTHVGISRIDGAAATQALAVHRRARRLLELFGTGEISALKSGAIGITTIRRLAAEFGLEHVILGFYIELLAAAGLIAADVPQLTGSTRRAQWIPTQAADSFLSGDEAAGWALLTTAWFTMARAPAQIGTKNAQGGVRNVLSEDLAWPAGPTQRHRILTEIATAAPGLGVSSESVTERLAFLTPLRREKSLTPEVTQLLAEATELGIAAFDGLSGPGRLIVIDDIEGAAAAMSKALPKPVDTLLVQADMTVVAPGRLPRELASTLATVAEVESVGSATVYRVSEASVRRALDFGMTASEIHELFAKHSVTPVPQSLTFVIDDVARRHGSVRAGTAGAYVRSDDATLLAQAVRAAEAAGIPLRSLAPTVAVSPIDLATLTDVLRDAGVSVMAENAAGGVVDLRPLPRRTRATPPRRAAVASATAPSSEQIAAAIARMRAGDVASSGVQESAEIIDVLHTAAAARHSVWIGYADTEGSTARRMVNPLVVSGGTMVAFDTLRNAPRTFSLHRVSSAHPAD